MTSPVGGIDSHQDTFTVGIVDAHGVEITHETFHNTAASYLDATGLLDAHGVRQVGVEGSAKWGAHVAVALAAAGFDARAVPPSRSAAQRRSRRLDKTDAVDAVASARALQAEPTLGPAPTLEIYDPLVAKTEAVLEHLRALVAARTLLWHHVGDQIAKLPAEIGDQLNSKGKIEGRVRRLEGIAPTSTRRPPARTGSNGSRRSSTRTAQRVARSPPRTPHRQAAQRTPNHPARQTRHRADHSSDPAVRGRRSPPARPRAQVRPLQRHRRRGAVIGRESRQPHQAPARLQRQPAHQQRALHRVGHPAAQPARRGRPALPQSHRKQDPTRSPTSPQTPTRQPDHPPHVARRSRPTTAPRTSGLTRERLTVPNQVTSSRSVRARPPPWASRQINGKGTNPVGQRLRLAQTDRHTTIMSVFGAHDAVGGSVRRR